MSDPIVLTDPASHPVTADTALKIAQTDAANAYRDLSHFRIQLTLESDGWHVEYDPKNPRHKGGGPHYVISDVTGEIVSKRYYQ
jgi:hypothetical protein